MSSAEPSLTAIVVCHNHEPYVETCLRSIAEQTAPADRLVLVDDGSRDASFEVAERFVREHFPDHRLIRHAEPLGVCRSLNEALQESRGEFVAEISADDYWLPDKNRSQLEAFATEGPDVAVVYGDAMLIDENDRPTGRHFLEWVAPDGVPDSDGLFDRLLLRGNFLPGMAAMIRRDRLVEVGGWDESLFYEDWDMWLQLSSRWRFVRQPDVVAAYRVLETSMSNTRKAEMSLSDLAIATKWAGYRVRADARTLRLTSRLTLRSAGRGDFRYLASWARLALVALTRRLPFLSPRRRSRRLPLQ